VEQASALVTKHMVTTYYAAGKPEEVRDQMIELVGAAGRLGYDQVAFAKLGPITSKPLDYLRIRSSPH